MRTHSGKYVLKIEFDRGWVADPRGVLMTGPSRSALLLVLGLTTVVLLVSCSPEPEPVSVNGRILLTHPSTGVSGDAEGSGVLGENPEGCVTMDELVLVVPYGSGLAADGSITVLGRTHKPGSSLKFGGGLGKAPTGSKCGSHSDYFWVG
jgi:hypothetical protein